LKLVSSDKLQELPDLSKITAPMFGSKHICEYTVSSMQAMQFLQRNRLTDTHLQNILQISSTSLIVEFKELHTHKNAHNVFNSCSHVVLAEESDF
jgi:hypothetical protein